MPLFKRRVDPVEERSQALKAEIAALESQIRKLNHAPSQPPTDPSVPKLRSTARPQSGAVHLQGSSVPSYPTSEPIFQDTHNGVVPPPTEPMATAQHYNELGVRKYDLAAAVRRAQNHFKSKPVTNPKLVNYLAAGSIHGLRPLRYEKRIARNRVLFLSVVLILVIMGMFKILLKY